MCSVPVTRWSSTPTGSPNAAAAGSSSARSGSSTPSRRPPAARPRNWSTCCGAPCTASPPSPTRTTSRSWQCRFLTWSIGHPSPMPGVEAADAVVIGAGPNGLVAANVLADAGWSVVVLEAADEPGGSVRTASLTLPGFGHDVCSAFYPLAAASPVFRELDLEVRWRHAPSVLAHVFPDDRHVLLSRDLDRTACSLATFDARDADTWCAEFERWQRVRDDLL